MMAAAALRVSCLNTALVLHRACISASYDFSASSLVGRRSFPWRAGTMWGVHSISKTRLVQNAGDMSSSETPPSFSGEGEAEVALSKKKCTPCSSRELRPMTEESTRSLLEQVPGWDLLEVDGQLQLQKNWKAKNFVKGLEFIKSIAEVAESEGGLSENDFILAAKINTLSGEGFLRKSVAKSTPKPPTVAI